MKVTGLSGSALERREPRCLPFLSDVASTEFWHIEANTTIATSIVHHRSLIVLSTLTTDIRVTPQTRSSTTVSNGSAISTFHVSLDLSLNFSETYRFVTSRQNFRPTSHAPLAGASYRLEVAAYRQLSLYRLYCAVWRTSFAVGSTRSQRVAQSRRTTTN